MELTESEQEELFTLIEKAEICYQYLDGALSLRKPNNNQERLYNFHRKKDTFQDVYGLNYPAIHKEYVELLNRTKKTFRDIIEYNFKSRISNPEDDIATIADYLQMEEYIIKEYYNYIYVNDSNYKNEAWDIILGDEKDNIKKAARELYSHMKQIREMIFPEDIKEESKLELREILMANIYRHIRNE